MSIKKILFLMIATHFTSALWCPKNHRPARDGEGVQCIGANFEEEKMTTVQWLVRVRTLTKAEAQKVADSYAKNNLANYISIRQLEGYKLTCIIDNALKYQI